MADNVIQGQADLDITPFLSALTRLSTSVNTTVQQVTTKLQGLNTALAGTGNAATAATTSVANQMQTVGRNANQYLTPAMQQLKSVEDAFNSIYRAGAQISQVGMSLGLLGGAITGLTALATKSAGDFDFWARKAVAAAEAAGQFMTQLEGTVGVQQAYREAISGVAEVVGTLGLDQVAEATYLWQSAVGVQISSLDHLNALSRDMTTILKAASATATDHASVIRGTAQILGGFRMGVSETTHVVQSLMNATQVSNMEFGDAIEAMKMVGPASHAAGIGFDDVVAVLAKLSDAGIRGSQAGRGLQRLLGGFIDPSKEAAAALATVLEGTDALGRAWRDQLFPGGKFVGILDSTTASGQEQLGLIGRLYSATIRYHLDSPGQEITR